MIKNKLLEAISTSCNSPKCTELLANMDEKTNDMLALDSSLKEYNMERNKIWRAMSKLYWEIAEEILRSKFVTPGEAPETLNFTPEEELFLNYGYFSGDVSSVPPSTNTPCRSVFTVQNITEWISENFCLFFDRDCSFLNQRIAESEADMNMRKNTIISKLKIMVPLVLSSGEGAPISRREAEVLMSEWSEALVSYSFVAAKTSEWRTNDEEARKKIASDARKFIELTERIGMFLKNREIGGDREAVTRLNNFLYECRNICVFKAYMSKEYDKLKQKQERMVKKYENDFVGAKTSFIDMLNQKKEYASLMSKQIRREYSPLLDEDGIKDIAPTRDLQVAIYSVLFADPGLLTVPRIRMYGMPKILLVPGRGVGAYDWSDNTLLLPVSPVQKNAERALAYACASFRWDTDEERLLKDTYDKLKENKGKNIIDMGNSFAKDYFLWVSKESKGYRILPRENHKWFSSRFTATLDVF